MFAIGCIIESMSDLTIHGETAETLITSMQAHGFTVTRPELARWHRAGLLPRPERHSLGRGRGMISIYPHGTADQLLALCRINRSEKRLPLSPGAYGGPAMM